jgi:hypothetical protein
MSEPQPDPSTPFLVYRDDDGNRCVHALDPASRVVTIGRAESADVSLPWDGRVSRLHARLELVGDDVMADWSLVDDDSRNGSFRNGERVRGRTRVSDGDTLLVGDTTIGFCVPGGREAVPGAPAPTRQEPNPFDPRTTVLGSRVVTRASLSDSQRRVLAALAKPYRPDGSGSPATDEQIAAELFLGVATVRSLLDKLFAIFAVDPAMAEDERRRRLVERAMRSGIIG